MRILFFITELYPGGAERIVWELACRFNGSTGPDGQPVAVAVAALDGRGEYADRLRAAGIAVHDLMAYSVVEFLPALIRLRRLLRKGKFDLLNTHLYHADIIGRLAAAGMGVPVAGVCHIAERRFAPWRFRLDRLTARFARAAICVSRAVRDFQRERTTLPDDFFQIIYNGIDLARFHPYDAYERAARRRAMGLPESGLLVGFLGRFDLQKGADVFLRALGASPLRERTDFAAVLAGYGTEEKHLRKLASSLPHPKQVLFAGYQAEPERFLPLLDLCVVPSRWEGFGLVAVEAQACGAPVVASRVDSLPEVVAEGAGAFVAPDDPGALAAELARWLDDPALRASASACGVQAARLFSLDKMCGAYLECFCSLLSHVSRKKNESGDAAVVQR